VDYLSEDARYAAEVRAIQELKDLAGYVEIYTDNTLDSTFSEKAGEMIRGIFISEDARLSFGQIKNAKIKSAVLGEFLKTGFGEEIRKAEVIFDSILVQQPLQKSDESTYAGKLAAFQTIILYPSSGSILTFSNPVTIHFISSKQVKIIGQDTLRVWEIALGDMDF
jgi:hypothetical protein